MPNHLMSKLHFSGEQKRIDELLESIKGEETLFDFNKVLPMPESLNSISSTSIFPHNYTKARGYGII